jgi:hypothetical protein
LGGDRKEGREKERKMRNKINIDERCESEKWTGKM